MPRGEQKRKKIRIVHLSQIRGYWKHFFIVCGLVIFIWILLSPYADINPSWREPKGMKLVPSVLDDVHGIKGVPHRFLVISKDSKKNTDNTYLVNDQLQPVLYLRPGQTVRLEIVNSTANDIFEFVIPGYTLYVISRDGKPLGHVEATDHEFMVPGSRIQVLFTPTWYATIPVKSLYYHRGVSETTLLHVKVQGIPMLPSPLPIKLTP